MTTLFDGTCGSDDIVAILDRMEANCPYPSSQSRELWRLRHAAKLAGHNRSRETMLEKAVAMLAANGHMPGWYNQCPVASGIGDSARHRHRSVDLVHWRAADRRLSLIELKWDSDNPSDATRQILRYGAAWLFCRKHRDRLPVGKRPAMSARHVALRVAAPARYYAGDGLADCLSRARKSLKRIERDLETWGLSMSLDVLAFPEWFRQLPFGNGAEVQYACDDQRLTQTGREIVNAFNGLASVYPERDRS